MKVHEQLTMAIRLRKALVCSPNTRTEVGIPLAEYPGSMVLNVLLFGNHIASVIYTPHAHRILAVRMTFAGWPTPTTTSRLRTVQYATSITYFSPRGTNVIPWLPKKHEQAAFGSVPVPSAAWIEQTLDSDDDRPRFLNPEDKTRSQEMLREHLARVPARELKEHMVNAVRVMTGDPSLERQPWLLLPYEDIARMVMEEASTRPPSMRRRRVKNP